MIKINKRRYVGNKIRVYCLVCKEDIGYKIKNRYYLTEGTIKQGQGKNKHLINFCSKKCNKSFKKLSKKHFRGIVE